MNYLWSLNKLYNVLRLKYIFEGPVTKNVFSIQYLQRLQYELKSSRVVRLLEKKAQMIGNLYCTQTTDNTAVTKMLSAPMGVQGEFVFTTKMLFALLLLTSTSFGQVKFWWPGLLEMCMRSISWSPYAWWIWPWCQVVDLPQDRSRGTPWSAGQDFLTLPLGLLFMDKRKVPE